MDRGGHLKDEDNHAADRPRLVILARIKEHGLAAFDHCGNAVAARDGPLAADDAEQLRTRCRVTTQAATGTEVHAAEMAFAVGDCNPRERSLRAPVTVDVLGEGFSEVDEPHLASFSPASCEPVQLVHSLPREVVG